MRQKRIARSRKSARRKVPPEPHSVDWSQMLEEAITSPGVLSTAYTAFWNYSIGNQLIALFDCMRRGIPAGPIHTFKGWIKLGRHVRRGEKAIELCMPVSWIEKVDPKKYLKPNENAADHQHVVLRRRFIFKPNWFVLAQTDGADLPPQPIPDWCAERALSVLQITEVPFDLLDGNCQGFARDRKIAVSPVAYHPERTRFHEMAHILLGHTAETTLTDGQERTPRDLREVEAEAVAYLCIQCLGLGGEEFSRGYLQHWLKSIPHPAGEKPIPEKSVHRIFHAADQILKAGQPASTFESESADSHA